MALLPVVLFLTAVLLPSFPTEGKDPSFTALITTQTQVQREIVNKHNELRKSVSPPASNMLKMEWSREVTANAQKWANKCILEHSNPNERQTTPDREFMLGLVSVPKQANQEAVVQAASGKYVASGTKCGENLYMSSDPMAWSDAIQSWFDEHHDFVYGSGPKSASAIVGHYTQLVWYSSFRVGCGIAYCPNQESLKYYYVCQYCPAGNNVNKKNTPYQQGTPCGSCPGNCDNGLCTNTCEYEDLLSNCDSLKKTAGCEHELLKEKCKATCLCEGKIY